VYDRRWTDVPSCTRTGSVVDVTVGAHPFSDRHSSSVARLPCTRPPAAVPPT
jgi:hypothetical protein